MKIEKKIYQKDQPVATGEGNPEKLLLLIESKEVVYFPEYSKEYFFSQDTKVFEIVFDESKKNYSRPENMASPFSLTGDACFYNFMARKIKISGEQEFFNKKGKPLLWLISGDLQYKKAGENSKKLENTPVFLEEENTVYSITGNGEVFLLKI